MSEYAEYIEWIGEMRSLDWALHEQGKCEYPCPYCLAKEESNERTGKNKKDKRR